MRTETLAADGARIAPPLWPGLALAAAGSIAFSGKAIIVKLAYRHGVDAVTLITYRMLFALPLFALLAWWAGRGKPALTRRDWLVVSGLGFSGYYLASFGAFALISYLAPAAEDDVYLDDLHELATRAPGTAATLTNQLITQDKVDLLMSDSGSVLTAVSVPIAREHKMLLLDTTGTGAPFFTK